MNKTRRRTAKARRRARKYALTHPKEIEAAKRKEERDRMKTDGAPRAMKCVGNFSMPTSAMKKLVGVKQLLPISNFESQSIQAEAVAPKAAKAMRNAAKKEVFEKMYGGSNSASKSKAKK